MRTDKVASSFLAVLVILVLAPGSFCLPGLGKGGPGRTEPSSSRRAAANTAACLDTEKYTEDFETGFASNWYLGQGFQIVDPGGGKILLGGGTSYGLATYLLGDYWTDFFFSYKMRLLTGEAWVSLRYNTDGEDYAYDRIRPVVTQRYFVRFVPGSIYLIKQDSGTYSLLGGAPISLDPNQWYGIGIIAAGVNLAVFVNNSPVLVATDTSPVASGSIALETVGNTFALFDDLQVAANVPCEKTWTQTKTFPQGVDINVIAFNPSDSNVVYAGTEHAGVWRSSDGGLTWAEVGYSGDMGRLGKTQGIAVASADPRIVYAAWSGELDRSTDGGLHWTRTNLQGNQGVIQAVAVQPNSTDVVYIATSGTGAPGSASQGGVFKTSDGGWTFQTSFNSGALAMAIPASSPSVLYVGTTTGISKSTDGGTSWTTVYTLSGASTKGVASIAVDPSDSNTVYATADGVMKSTDGGKSWSKVNDGTQQIVVSSSRPEVVYLRSGGNILRSGDRGATWTTARPVTNKPYGLSTIAVDPSNPDKMFAGTWGQGIFFSKDGGTTWSTPDIFVGPADLGVAVAVHPGDSKKVYLGTSKGEIYSTADGGDTWTKLANLGTGSAYLSLITGLVIDPLNPDTLYASNLEGVFKSTDRGVTWKTINTGLTDSRIISLAIDPKDPKRVYAGTGSSRPRNTTDGSGMFYTTNGGDSWASVPGLPAAPIPAVVVSPLDTNVIYAAAMGFGVYKSTDAGNSWTQMNTGLQNLCVYALAMDPGSADVVYVGTNSGYCKSSSGKPDNLYKTTDGGKNWSVVLAGEKKLDNMEAIVVDPANPSNVYVANHTERIWFSGDAGSTWNLANQNVIRHGAHLYLWAFGFDSAGTVVYLTTCGRGILRNFTKTQEVR